MVFDPPALLDALRSAIRSETVAAVKLEGSVRSSNCSRVSRPGLCGEGREATEDRVLGRFRQPRYHGLNHMMDTPWGTECIPFSDAVCDRMSGQRPRRADRAPGRAGPVRLLLGGEAHRPLLLSPRGPQPGHGHQGFFSVSFVSLWRVLLSAPPIKASASPRRSRSVSCRFHLPRLGSLARSAGGSSISRTALASHSLACSAWLRR